MRKKRKLKKGSNTKLAIIFFSFVVLIISISLIINFMLILSQSKFDDSKNFAVTISNQKNLEVISFSPGSVQSGFSPSLSILKLEKNLGTSPSQFLAIPIDGFIRGDDLVLNEKIESMFFRMILNYKNLQTNLTVIDFIKLFIFAKSLPEREIQIKNIYKAQTINEIDSVVSRLVSDDQIEKEGKTIHIINGTNVSGLGNRLARLIANIGGDVIIVATSDDSRKYSEISYIGNKSYTVERLGKILKFKTIKAQDKTIADITIIIGNDGLSVPTF